MHWLNLCRMRTNYTALNVYNVGVYYSAMGPLRAHYIDDSSRGSIMGLFRYYTCLYKRMCIRIRIVLRCVPAIALCTSLLITLYQLSWSSETDEHCCMLYWYTADLSHSQQVAWRACTVVPHYAVTCSH
jgi:hypothetical protein